VIDARNAASKPQTFEITVNAVNDGPRAISLSRAEIAENTRSGTAIGELTGSDPEGDPLTFILLDGTDERFALQTQNGVTSLVVKDGVRLDYEQSSSHTINVQATDVAGATFTKTFTIAVNDEAREAVTGSTSSDVIKGGRGNDTFSGGSGDDRLWGGNGNDTLRGDEGRDVFVFDTKAHTKANKDKLVDFKVADDSLWLDHAVFTKLGKTGSETSPVQVKKGFFVVGSKSKDRNDYIVHDKSKGLLLYDADGSGRGKAVEIASLPKTLSMTYKDLFVI
jgi:Ca2+-binding RTX toxin-like protein